MSKQSGKKPYEPKLNANKNSLGELKIIGGKWRSRKLTFPAIAGLRPSPSRIRETLFSWLTPVLSNSRCLDLFAGSGALGFEALSRGAESVIMIEQSREIVQHLKSNQKRLDADQLQILNQDARLLSEIEGSFDIVFCDPPFNQGLVQPLIENLHQSGLLKHSARLYVETEKNLTSLILPENWSLLKEKVAGDVRYRLIEVSKH